MAMRLGVVGAPAFRPVQWRSIAKRALAPALLLVLAVPGACQQQPHLEQRGDANPAVPLDAQITAPVTIPTEAWGHYTFAHELDLLEVDIEPRGLTGYITLWGDPALKHTPDRNAPLTFFFSKTRVGGDSVYFLTQQIHRLSYEFTGTLSQTPPKDKSLAVGYALVGILTTHHLDSNGHDHTEQRHVEFKRLAERAL